METYNDELAEALSHQLLETWDVNHRTNLLLMDELSEDALPLTLSPRGGGTVGNQLAHLHNVRFWKLERHDRPAVQGHAAIKAAEPKDLPMLRQLHELSASWVRAYLEKSLQQGGEVKGWSRGVVTLLGYFIHHEAHHRGNIMLTLKLAKYTRSEVLKYGIWDWDKI